jgi:hypothetical protein
LCAKAVRELWAPSLPKEFVAGAVGQSEERMMRFTGLAIAVVSIVAPAQHAKLLACLAFDVSRAEPPPRIAWGDGQSRLGLQQCRKLLGNTFINTNSLL